MDSPPIPGELLADIFLRLPDPADLVRVSAGCTSFRHLIADRSFLRRYRRLHAPPFLGFLDYNRVFHAVVTPHPSASAAGAVALAADFSFSFLPGPASDWAVQDVRDGRVLLERHPKFEVIFREVIVCDPLHRRYLLLPPIPGDLAESVDSALWTKPQTFLAPSEDEEEASFSVISMVQCLTKLFAFAFFSNTGQWRTISSQSWSNLFAGLPSLAGMTFFSRREYAYGLFYWVASSREKLLVLDSQSMEFSIVEHPPEARGIPGGDIAIVEAGDGRPGMFVRAEETNYLNYAIRRNDFGSSSKWQLDKKIPLDSGFSVFQGLLTFILFHPVMPHVNTVTNGIISGPVLETGLRTRRWNKALLQDQAHSQHGQSNADADSGGQVVSRIRDAGDVVTQLRQ
ncbi:uncharacterized protein LOC125516396 [Triticum urartu]|uniref:uncharacterized protein LOC125516396 n=1 Tax=Triticum urartu TaxID=4572 RepID=UPI00204354AC|nr:uncharacterized protein LOC125516396 [Triticum urartu]